MSAPECFLEGEVENFSPYPMNVGYVIIKCWDFNILGLHSDFSKPQFPLL